VVEYLTSRGFVHFSVRGKIPTPANEMQATNLESGSNSLTRHALPFEGYLLEIIREKGLPEERSSMSLVANELRANHSPDYIVAQLVERAQKDGKDCIIESIRTPGEIDCLQRLKATLLAVDADPKLRYDRVVVRGSSTDKISYEQFVDEV
jgi:hypothetical protein